jgi:2-polyprenyl-3-methyl-5-hydroxy-6-metoxy-1,4-benzoquinol methylase
MSVCPICGRESNEVIRGYTASGVAAAFFPPRVLPEKYSLVEKDVARIWQSDQAKVLRCQHCNFGFASPFRAGDADFYEHSSYDTAYPRDKFEYGRTIEWMEKGGDLSTKTVLEIGAGKGYFLEKLIERGALPSQLVASEFSSSGREAIEALGVKCVSEDIRNIADELGQKFDFIVMFQVLEHMDDYPGLAKAVKQLSHRNSRIFISVPNGRRIDYNEEAGLLLDMPPNHVSRWYPESFKSFAQNYRMSVTACEIEGTSTRFEMTYAMINRFLRKSQDAGTWPNRVSNLADRLSSRNRRLVKLAGH